MRPDPWAHPTHLSTWLASTCQQLVLLSVASLPRGPWLPMWPTGQPRLPLRWPACQGGNHQFCQTLTAVRSPRESHHCHAYPATLVACQLPQCRRCHSHALGRPIFPRAPLLTCATAGHRDAGTSRLPTSRAQHVAVGHHLPCM
jgi:hypothetical protein